MQFFAIRYDSIVNEQNEVVSNNIRVVESNNGDDFIYYSSLTENKFNKTARTFPPISLIVDVCSASP